MIDYHREESDMNAVGITEVIKALVRPGITAGFVGMTIAAIFTGHVGDIPEWFRTLGITAVAWWYIDRTMQKNAANGSS